jgi:hypothetical protein
MFHFQYFQEIVGTDWPKRDIENKVKREIRSIEISPSY